MKLTLRDGSPSTLTGCIAVIRPAVESDTQCPICAIALYTEGRGATDLIISMGNAIDGVLHNPINVHWRRGSEPCFTQNHVVTRLQAYDIIKDASSISAASLSFRGAETLYGAPPTIVKFTFEGADCIPTFVGNERVLPIELIEAKKIVWESLFDACKKNYIRDGDPD